MTSEVVKEWSMVYNYATLATVGADGSLKYLDESLHPLACAIAEECAKEADISVQICGDAGRKHPEESESRDRCFARAREARNIAEAIRAKFK